MRKKLLLFFINIFIFSLFSYSQSIKKLPVKVLTNIQLPTVEEIEEREKLLSIITLCREQILREISPSFFKKKKLKVIGYIDPEIKFFYTKKKIIKTNKNIIYIITIDNIDFPIERKPFIDGIEVFSSYSEKIYIHNKYVYLDCWKFFKTNKNFSYILKELDNKKLEVKVQR